MSTVERVKTVCSKDELTISDLEFLLIQEEHCALNEIFNIARGITDKYFNRNIYLRGLIEISNICCKNCYYCGIRRDNKIQRYTLSLSDIKKAIDYCYKSGFGSIVLQSGEQTGKDFVKLIAYSIEYAKNISNDQLVITLSLGEQTKDVYQYWFDAGADRYLLRIETSDPELYASLHPTDHSYEHRLQCLNTLKEIGYQVGTGVMIGVPGCTIHHLANDILFYKKMDVDMIGMGPYIVHPNTPTGTIAQNFQNYNKENIVRLSLLMIALTRIVCKDVNIASTTALEVLDSKTMMQSFYAGANVKMINITPLDKKKFYDLYEGKTSTAILLNEFEKEINSFGFSVCYHTKGDPLHYYSRRNCSCQ